MHKQTTSEYNKEKPQSLTTDKTTTPEGKDTEQRPSEKPGKIQKLNQASGVRKAHYR